MKPIEERFWSKVKIGKPDECWLWLSSRGTNGYGVFSVRDGYSTSAHRVAYQLSGGRILEDEVVDHLCRNIICVNPKHLQAVTQRTNIRRGLRYKGKSEPSQKKFDFGPPTHCPKGHTYTEDNTYVEKPTGRKRCKICRKWSHDRWLDKNRDHWNAYQLNWRHQQGH